MAEKGMKAGTGQLAMGADSAGNADFLAASVQTSAVTKVDSTGASQTVLALNAARRGASFYNTDANDCYLKFGATASLTSFTVKIPSGGYFEAPMPIYTGIVDAIRQ